MSVAREFSVVFTSWRVNALKLQDREGIQGRPFFLRTVICQRRIAGRGQNKFSPGQANAHGLSFRP